MSESTFRVFRELAGWGFSVIPLAGLHPPIGKTVSPCKGPLLKWTEWQNRQPAEELHRHWADKFPDCNFGVVTGKVSGIVVIDVDDKHADEDFLAEFQIPVTVKAKTGRGYHYYFRRPAFSIRNATGIRSSVDVRADGGYVVAPPSFHISKAQYTWERSPDDAPFAEIPEDLMRLLVPGGYRGYTYARKALSTEVGNVLQAKEGGRNSTLNRAMFGMAGLVASGYIDPGPVKRALYNAALELVESSVGSPDEFTEEEAKETLKSAFQAGFRRPIVLPPEEEQIVAHVGMRGHGPPVTVTVPADPVPPPTDEPTVQQEGPPVDPEERRRIFLPPTPPPPRPEDNRAKPRKPEYTPDDVGNAELLIDLHGHNLRFNHTTGGDRGWLRWDAVRWKECQAAEQMELAIDVTEFLSSFNDKDMLPHIRRSRNLNALNRMLGAAKGNERIRVVREELDSDPLLVNTLNGTINLAALSSASVDDIGATVDQWLRPHDQADLMTKTLRASWDEQASYDRWCAFLVHIFAGDMQLIEFLQRAIGYTLTGLTSEQKAFLQVGAGKNGKSVFREALRYVFFDYGTETPFDTFETRRNPGAPRPDLADLDGSRLVVASEGPENMRFDEATFKALTGGESVRTRRLMENLFSFLPQCKFWLATNHKPRISGGDDGIWRRIYLIVHRVQIAVDEMDPHLADTLKSHADGILRWALEGYVKWTRVGLAPPATVISDTLIYRQEQDVLGQFLEDRCLWGEKLDANRAEWITKAELMKAYELWCKEYNERPWTSRMLGNKMMERIHTMDVTDGTKSNNRVWIGLQLRGLVESTAGVGYADSKDPFPVQREEQVPLPLTQGGSDA